MTVTITIITRDRTEELEAVLASIGTQEWPDVEVLVGDNGSEGKGLGEIRRICEGRRGLKLHEFGRNLGVSGGRNELLRLARGEIVIEIDDDAVFATKDGVPRAVKALKDRPDAGIIAFKITNPGTGGTDRIEYPFLNKRREVNRAGEAAWFIGCGHAFRRKALDEIGLYHDFFPYGAEELDYAFRAIDRRWSIWYEPTIEVIHRKSQKHRIVDPVQWGTLSMKQRMKVAVLNLPIPMCVSYFLIRSIRYSRGFRHPSVIWKACGQLWKEREYVRAHRKPISFAAVRKLWKLRGPLFF